MLPNVGDYQPDLPRSEHCAIEGYLCVCDYFSGTEKPQTVRVN
jgi:hypothetical protein